MLKEGYILPDSTESVEELDIKKAAHSLILYMGETEQTSVDMTVDIPGGYRVVLNVELVSVEETAENE